MALEFRRSGRKVSQNDFFKGLGEDLLDNALEDYAEELHGKAASVVDPETGKHAAVFVRRVGREHLSIHTSGSPAFARALEERLGLNIGEVHGVNDPAERERLVYLAHASEDKPVAKPLAEGLIERGIPVWYDNWEICYGDSLRRKMEQGLGNCTHFVVLLTETSISKPWVNEEIDAGLMSAVEGSAKFIGLRYGLPLTSVSPFLRTRLTPDFVPGPEGLDALAAEIFGVSKRPPLGEKPRYVQTHEAGSTWSTAARVVAEYFVRNSEHAQSMDPQTNYTTIEQATGLPRVDVRIGVLDLTGAGLIERQDYLGGESALWPAATLSCRGGCRGSWDSWTGLEDGSASRRLSRPPVTPSPANSISGFIPILTGQESRGATPRLCGSIAVFGNTPTIPSGFEVEKRSPNAWLEQCPDRSQTGP